MKRKFLTRCVFAFAVTLVYAGVSFSQKANNAIPASRSGNGNITDVQFHETDSVFANPGQGWMSSRFPSSIRYLRIGWSELEPEHGKG